MLDAIVESLRQKLAAKKSIIIHIKVIPKSPHCEISGVMSDDTIKIRVKSAPEKGKANQEVIDLLDETLSKYGISASSIEILRGSTARTKKIKISG